MAANGRTGGPASGGFSDERVGPVIDDAMDVEDEVHAAEADLAGRDAELAAIREELMRLKETVRQLSDVTARYARQRFEGTVERHPFASVLAAAFAGYWLAGSRRR